MLHIRVHALPIKFNILLVTHNKVFITCHRQEFDTLEFPFIPSFSVIPTPNSVILYCSHTNELTK